MPTHTCAKQALYTALANIRAGSVITYGQLAAMAGRPGGARWAGKVLRELPAQSTLPWHRVVNAAGKISLPANSPAALMQRQKLQDEGVECHPRISLTRYGY